MHFKLRKNNIFLLHSSWTKCCVSKNCKLFRKMLFGFLTTVQPNYLIRSRNNFFKLPYNIIFFCVCFKEMLKHTYLAVQSCSYFFLFIFKNLIFISIEFSAERFDVTSNCQRNMQLHFINFRSGRKNWHQNPDTDFSHHGPGAGRIDRHFSIGNPRRFVEISSTMFVVELWRNPCRTEFEVLFCSCRTNWECGLPSRKVVEGSSRGLQN